MSKKLEPSTPQIEYITYTRLIKELGWSKELAEKYLPEPTLVPNPYYKCAAPMKLYSLEDVQKVSQTEPVRGYLEARMEKRAKRAESSKKAVATKKLKLFEEVNKKIEQIVVELLDDSTLRNLTISAKNNWNAWNDYKGTFTPINSSDVDKSTMDRWVVNYIRHNLTEYDEDLYNMKGKTGVREEYFRYKNVVLDKISEVYPKYKQECERQKIKIEEN